MKKIIVALTLAAYFPLLSMHVSDTRGPQKYKEIKVPVEQTMEIEEETHRQPSECCRRLEFCGQWCLAVGCVIGMGCLCKIFSDHI